MVKKLAMGLSSYGLYKLDMSVVKESNYVCSYCGLGGYKKPSELKRYKNHFCNRVCHAKFKDKRVEVKCDYEGCENKFLKREWEALNTKNNFCSEVCGGKFRDKKVEVECFHCHKKFMKKLCAVITSKKHFCSELCAKNLQNYKDWGGKRSKLEIAIEEHFKDIFPFMYIRYNKTDIGHELDIHVTCLELAIELNGVFHYRVIHKKNGVERLKRTQEIDAEKVVKCEELDIKLFVIDVSRDGSGKKIKAQRISQVEQIVRDRIIELSYVFENKQMLMEI
jgi:hypothetical protein